MDDFFKDRLDFPDFAENCERLDLVDFPDSDLPVTDPPDLTLSLALLPFLKTSKPHSFQTAVSSVQRRGVNTVPVVTDRCLG